MITAIFLIRFSDDLEVDRLLTEIDDAVKLLPFLVEKDKKASSSQEVEQVLQHYKNENDQLRRFVERSQFSYSSSSLQFRRKYEMILK